MKKIATFLAISLLGFSAFSQITLTSTRHGLKPGDVQVMLRAEYADPGPGGAKQVWNFSDLKIYSEERNLMLDATTVEKYGVMPSATVAVTTGGDYHGMFRITATENDNIGYFGKDYHVVFSQPHRRMIYPFTFGDSYRAHFSGYGVYPGATTDIAGDYSFEADAYGTLILPNNILTNVLRVRTNVSRYEFARCYSSETHQTRYLYYTEDQRYPVFAALEVMWVNHNQDTTWHRSVAVNESVHAITPEDLLPEPLRPKVVRKEYIYSVFPNPFRDNLNVSFVLDEQTHVSVELYTVDGLKLNDVVSRRLLNQGSYEFNYNTSALPAAAYFVKFIFNDQAFVKQAIRIK